MGGLFSTPFFYYRPSMENDISIEERLRKLSEKIVSDCSLCLYDTEYVKSSSTLRVFIYNKETQTAVIEDCVAVDRAFDPYCEDADWLPDNFVLEVSSPGVYRNIRTQEHLDQALNKGISLKLKNFLDEKGDSLPKELGKNKKLEGILVAHTETELEIEIKKYNVKINMNNIKQMNLNPDIQQGSR